MAYKQYALASPTGLAIPNDIISPIAHVRQAIAATAMVSPLLYTTEEPTTIMLGLVSNVDCAIAFDDTTPISSLNSGVLFIPANVIVQVAPPTKYISVIGTGAGNLDINVMDRWDTLATELQTEVG